MTTRIGSDRLREFVDLMIASLDEPVDGSTMAARAFVSRFHFDRLVSAALGESPTAFRRRMLLERAAWGLGRGEVTVTDSAIEAGYGSVEGFGRAFGRLFGIAPSRYRGSGRSFRAAAPNGVHFHPPGGLFIPGPRREGGTAMDLTDRLVAHDLWLTGRLLDRAAMLPPEELDRPVWREWGRMPFDAEEPTVRSMVARLVWTKENWIASVLGRPAPEEGDTSIEGLRRRLEAAGPEFAELLRGIRDRRDWDSGFVDALCDPPESFTFGGMAAHVVTFSAYRRQVLIKALATLGADDVGIGDPAEWERSLS